MNEEQIKRINDEANRLFERISEIITSINYSDELKVELKIYIDGKIDALKWVKENI